MNQESQDKGIEEITRKIQELKFYHRKSTEVITQLEKDLRILRSNNQVKIARTVQESKVTLEDCKKLIGKNVRIVNPGKGEGNFGHISAVGELYVTIIIQGGVAKRRIARNIRLLHHD